MLMKPGLMWPCNLFFIMFVMTLCALRGFSTFLMESGVYYYTLLKMFVLFSSITCELSVRCMRLFCIVLRANYLLVCLQINTSDVAL